MLPPVRVTSATIWMCDRRRFPITERTLTADTRPAGRTVTICPCRKNGPENGSKHPVRPEHSRSHQQAYKREYVSKYKPARRQETRRTTVAKRVRIASRQSHGSKKSANRTTSRLGSSQGAFGHAVFGRRVRYRTTILALRTVTCCFAQKYSDACILPSYGPGDTHKGEHKQQ
jgi:hypothetical protein